MWTRNTLNRVLKILAILAGIFYISWNGYFLWHKSVPPSIFYALTGYPAPTTGGTRATIALLRGDIELYFSYNPFTLLFIILIFYSIFELLKSWFYQKKLRLSTLSVTLWIFILVVAWVWQILFYAY